MDEGVVGTKRKPLDPGPERRQVIEDLTHQIGEQLFARLDERRPLVLTRPWWDDRMLGWSMQDDAVKVRLFRFIDVLPMLDRDVSVARHLEEYLGEVRDRLPPIVWRSLAAAAASRLGQRVLAHFARQSALDLARRFIAGSQLAQVVRAAYRQRRAGRAFSLDVLGEAVTSEQEAERYLAVYLKLIEEVSHQAARWPEVPRIDHNTYGPVPRVNLSVKLSALDSQFDPMDFEGTTHRVARRLRELLRAARQHGAFIHVDMESYATKDVTLNVFCRVLAEDEFRDMSQVGIVIQAYLRDAESDLIRLIQWAQHRGTPVWVRLVKGAYWDYEVIQAQARGWPVPVFRQKWETDANFERLTILLLENHHLLRPALGTHNIRSIAHALAVAGQLHIPSAGLELQMLYGMGDPEKQALVDMGYRVRIYMPYGELIPGMAYLVRRLLENTSNDSFLRASFVQHVPSSQLLRPPGPGHESHESSGEPMSEIRQFQNEPPIDFARESNRQAMRQALEDVRSQLPVHAPLNIDGEDVDTDQLWTWYDPSHTEHLVGTVSMARLDEVARAIDCAERAYRDWQNTSVADRAQLLRQAAHQMCERHFELAARIVCECGKPWREATNDVCEAIDFCRYYAQQAEWLFRPRGVDVPGEQNQFQYWPRGVAAVIAPWNFPLAILTGMTTAALVTGNAVILKPAEQSSLIARVLFDLLRSVGVPAGVLQYLPGQGEIIGEALVRHPTVALIAFTGSRQVGTGIHAAAAETSRQCGRQVKQVICEMGGKNAIIVDDDADLDEAVLGVAHSALDYAGQKCSACSRVIVLDTVHDAFVARLIEAVRSLHVGPADDPATTVGPVIDSAALQKINQYIHIGRQECREILSVDVADLAQRGHFIGPHIFVDVQPEMRIAQEEIFGPVLAVLRAKDLDHAIHIANSTEYALTGGIYSRRPSHIQKAVREMAAGNLYINRSITGALVNRQPFGGFRMSGIGSQAGGSDYLLQFVVPRTICENTLRRGFAPPPAAESES